MADELKRFQPSEYYSPFINSDIRPDGRKLNSFGSTSIAVSCLNEANGSALVHLRDTTVLCGIKAELANPTAENPHKGFIVPNVDFPPICSTRFMPGPPSEEAQIFSQLMVDLLNNSSFIKAEDLCIIEGKLCWCLYIDITCLNYGGNVLDACVLSMISAAKDTSLPEVSNAEDTIRVSEVCRPLPVYDLTFSSTFALFNNSIVADPTTEEENCATGTVTVFVKDDGTICNIYMHRGCRISEESLKNCIRQSKQRSKALADIVNELIQCKNQDNAKTLN